MPRVSPLLALAPLVLAGCAAAAPVPARAGPASATPQLAAPAPEPDRALELAALLPAGADRCAVARPSRLPPSRRGLTARLSQADPFAWLPELALRAYASAQRESADGPSGQVVLLWVEQPPEQVRALLDAHSGLVFHWDGLAECTPAQCPLRASFVGPHMVRIERGPFLPAARAGVEAQCLRMAERSPASVEVSVTRSRVLGSFPWSALPVRSSVELAASAGGLLVTRVDRMRSPEDAERALEEGIVPEPFWAGQVGLAGGVQRTRVKAALHTHFELLWADLELARGDETRLEAAARDAAALAAMAPRDDAQPGAREDLLAELGFRLERLGQSSGEPRKQQGEAILSLLERALEQNPEDEGLALVSAELLLREQAQVARALVLVRRFEARAGANRAWAELDRHAAALTSARALEAVLVKQGLADRRKARAAADAIASRMREGEAFEQAERTAFEPAR